MGVLCQPYLYLGNRDTRSTRLIAVGNIQFIVTTLIGAKSAESDSGATCEFRSRTPFATSALNLAVPTNKSSKKRNFVLPTTIPNCRLDKRQHLNFAVDLKCDVCE